MAYIDNARAYGQAVFTAFLEPQLLGKDDYQPHHTGARSRQQEVRYLQNGEFRCPGVHMMGDVGQELPEDAELEHLVDMDIPALVVPGERSFDFVKAEVREQLSRLSHQKTRCHSEDSGRL